MNQAMMKMMNEASSREILDLPFEDYLMIDAVSNSLLKKVDQSPAHSQIPTTQTPDMLRGSLIDTAIIEPELFDAQYVVSPTTDKRKKEYKTFVKQLEDEGNKKIIIGQDDYDLALNCAQRIHSNKDLAAMLRRAKKQVTILWHDAEFGELCKGRPDWIDDPQWKYPNPDLSLPSHQACLWDLKSTRSSHPPFFIKEIYDRCYHMQAAWYLDGYNLCHPNDPPITQFSILAIEKTPPFGYRIFNLSADLIEAGRQRYRQTFNTLMTCRLDDDWPSYDTTPIEVGRPKWM